MDIGRFEWCLGSWGFLIRYPPKGGRKLCRDLTASNVIIHSAQTESHALRIPHHRSYPEQPQLFHGF